MRYNECACKHRFSFNKYSPDIQKELRERPMFQQSAGGEAAAPGSLAEGEAAVAQEGDVGVDDEKQDGFGIGVAPTGSKPVAGEEGAGPEGAQGGEGMSFLCEKAIYFFVKSYIL